jgi:hypothetical protein
MNKTRQTKTKAKKPAGRKKTPKPKSKPQTPGQSISIQNPPANSNVSLTFPVAGTVFPPGGTVDVTVASTTGGQTYQHNNVPVNMGGSWSTTFTVVADTYDITACIHGTSTCAQNDNVTAS